VAVEQYPSRVTTYRAPPRFVDDYLAHARTVDRLELPLLDPQVAREVDVSTRLRLVENGHLVALYTRLLSCTQFLGGGSS